MRRRSDVLCRRVPGFLALSREGRDVTVVHGAAADVWELLDGEADIAGISETLAARYDAPLTVVRRDVEALVRLLVDQGYLDVTKAGVTDAD